jgi:hypothetical protein
MYRRILVVLLLLVALSPLVAPSASADSPSATTLSSFWQTLLNWYQKTLATPPATSPTTSSESSDPEDEDKGFGMDPDGFMSPPNAGPTVDPNGLLGDEDLNGSSGDAGPTVDPNG